MFSKTYTRPGGPVPALFHDMTQQKHLLIAGATGSGKSVVVQGIMHTLLHLSPGEAGFMLIDPKKVELIHYRDAPHTLGYADTVTGSVELLTRALSIIDRRYSEMQKARVRLYTGGHIYIVIDELADLLTVNKRSVLPLLQRIGQIGRAAKVHMIACTQCPTSKIIDTPLRCNFDSFVGLRTRSAQDSRNILGCTGCETLPQYGECIYMTPSRFGRYVVPLTDDQQIHDIINYWTR